MSLRMLPVLCVYVLVAGVATPVGAQLQNPSVSTPTSLYFHIFDTFNLFPINTQAPDVAFFKVGGNNFPSIASQGFDFNTIRGFATSGPVEYNFIENGQPRFHPERGIAKDVQIDKSVKPVAHLYLNVRDFVGKHSLPDALPKFTFVVTMREGNTGDAAALDAFPIVMSGSMTAHVVDGSACPEDFSAGYYVTSATGVPTSDPRVPVCGVSANSMLPNGTMAPDGLPILVTDDNGTVEFRIPLDVAGERIPKADAYNVRIDWFQNPTGSADQDRQYSEGFLRLVSDATHHPRLDMAVLDPVYIEYIHPEVAAGILLIHTCVNSPWGTYDVDVANMTVGIDGPSTPVKLQIVTSQNAHNHGLHDKCAEVTYLWRFRDEGAKDGSYAIKLNVPNLNKSATAVGQAGFNVEGKKAFGIDEKNAIVTAQETATKASPSAGPLVALVVAGCALVMRRRNAA